MSSELNTATVRGHEVPPDGLLAEGSSAAQPPLLKVERLSKTFPGQQALREASISVAPAEVHALLGPNGSGKSTFIKVLTGYHDADPGARVWVHGSPATFGRVLRAEDGRELPVRAVHQDFGLIGSLNAVDNIALGIGYRSSGVRIQWRRQIEHTHALLAKLGAVDCDVLRPLDQCSPLFRTQVAIARVMADWGSRSGLLILDEPTAALPASQVGLLFDLVRGLRNQGLSVLYVSHRLGEIFELADRATVLREGRTVGTWPVAELDRDRLVSLMVAPPPVDAPETIAVSPPAAPQPLRPRTQAPRDDAVLEVADVQSTELRGLGFRLFAGEILGFAGLIGSGQEELPYILAGAGRVRSGTLRTSGATVELTRLRPRKAIQLGIGMVPANRAVEGLIGRFSILANMTLPRVRSFQRHGAISGRAESAFVAERMQALDVVPRDANRMVQLLSGGNAQKVVLAKWLGVSTSALVLAEPTAGVDVATRPIIYELLRELADGGLGIVVCSTDTSELAELCTRVVVLRDGLPVEELAGEAISEDRILRACLGTGATR